MDVHRHIGSARSLKELAALAARDSGSDNIVAGQKARPAAPHLLALARARAQIYHTHTSRTYTVYTDHSMSVLRGGSPRGGYGKEFF